MSIPQYPFSMQANRVLDWVREDAKRRNHSQIQPEHLLLGMLEDQKNVGRYILRALGVNLVALKESLLNVLESFAQEDDLQTFSEGSKKVFALGMQTSGTLYRKYLGTEHILIGILRNLGTQAYSLLRKSGVTYGEVLSQAKVMPPEQLPDENPYIGPIKPGEKITLGKLLLSISPIFWALVGLTFIAGTGLFYAIIPEKAGVFIFVTTAWILFVCLHEFAHALVAYWGGDHSVVNKGYLSLNPLKYTHGTISIVLPIIFLAMGGIGLPGGAVLINLGLIPKKRTQSLVSAAGPIMTGLITILLAFPFIFNLHKTPLGSQYFWNGLAFLVFVQITALLFNLLPLPGLDGFGIFRPYLPPQIAVWSNTFFAVAFTFYMIFTLFSSDSQISQYFWLVINTLINSINIHFDMVSLGFQLYQLW